MTTAGNFYLQLQAFEKIFSKFWYNKCLQDYVPLTVLSFQIYAVKLGLSSHEGGNPAPLKEKPECYRVLFQQKKLIRGSLLESV